MNTTTALRDLESLPGPKGMPILGSVAEARRDPTLLMEKAASFGGDAAFMRFGPYKYLVLHSAEGVHRVLVENAKAYHKSPSYRGLRLVLGNGLVTSEGEFW